MNGGRKDSPKAAKLVRVSGTLALGKVVEIGPLRLAATRAGFGVYYRNKAIIRILSNWPAPPTFIVETTSEMLPALRDSDSSPTGAGPQAFVGTDASAPPAGDGPPAGEMPILRLGPGGDFVRNVYPRELSRIEEPDVRDPRPTGASA